MARAGVVLLVPMLALPSLYGWYLGPALFMVAAASGSRYRSLLVALCSLLSFSSLPPMYGPSSWLLVGAWTLASSICLATVRRLLRTREPTGSSVTPTSAEEHPAPPTTPGMPADADHAGTRVPRRVPSVVGVAESMLVLLLVTLVAMRTAQATDQAHAGTQAQLANRSREVVHVGKLVQTSHPRRHLAKVLAKPGQHPTGVIRFDVELVLPGKGVCWIQVGVPPAGPATELSVSAGVASNAPPRCPEPSPPSRAPALHGQVHRPK
jgi:hypothetical protein